MQFSFKERNYKTFSIKLAVYLPHPQLTPPEQCRERPDCAAGFGENHSYGYVVTTAVATGY